MWLQHFASEMMIIDLTSFQLRSMKMIRKGIDTKATNINIDD